MSKHRWFFKASWRATAITFWVNAPNEDEAFLKAFRKVQRMLGGMHCMELVLVKVER